MIKEGRKRSWYGLFQEFQSVDRDPHVGCEPFGSTLCNVLSENSFEAVSGYTPCSICSEMSFERISGSTLCSVCCEANSETMSRSTL
jgi:hypothetical protein